MFHYKDNLFFGRRKDGSVRVVQFAQPPTKFPDADDDSTFAGAQFSFTVDKDSWCSVIASVSAGGEEGGRFYKAKEFHG